MKDLEVKLLDIIKNLEVLKESSFNVDKKAIHHQLVAYKRILKLIKE